MTAPVGEVTTPITSGENGGGFALGGEQTFGGEALTPLFEQFEQRADPRQFD